MAVKAGDQMIGKMVEASGRGAVTKFLVARVRQICCTTVCDWMCWADDPGWDSDCTTGLCDGCGFDFGSSMRTCAA